MARDEELANEQWAVIAPHLMELPRCKDRHGRTLRNNREVIDIIVCNNFNRVLSGKTYPAVPYCTRRVIKGSICGSNAGTLNSLPKDIHTCSDLALSKCFIEGTFIVVKREDCGAA